MRRAGAGRYLGTHEGTEFEVLDYQTAGPRGGMVREWVFRVILTGGRSYGPLSDPFATKAAAEWCAKRTINCIR